MPEPRHGPWLDDDAGRLVRPYTVSDGRTRPTAEFDLMTVVVATGTGSVARSGLGPEHAEVLGLCRWPMTVAEIAARQRLPATVIKVLLSDLVEQGAVTTRAFIPAPAKAEAMDTDLLEAVLDGLRKRL